MTRYLLLSLALAMLILPHGFGSQVARADSSGLGPDDPPIAYDIRVCTRWVTVQIPNPKNPSLPLITVRLCAEWETVEVTDDLLDCWENWEMHAVAAGGIAWAAGPLINALPPHIKIPLMMGVGGTIAYCALAEGQ